MNMTTQNTRWQGNDPDNPDDSSSSDGTHRPSCSSQDEISDSYPLIMLDMVPNTLINSFVASFTGSVGFRVISKR